VAEPLQPIGFWSYTSSDDQHSDGRLSQLRRLVARELQLLIGQRPLVDIFQDVAAIAHGADWAEKIYQALDRSSFLIPIVTPGFLQSEWCCKEVIRFRQREEALGRNDLIFPFRYISIDDADPDDPADCHDPAVFRLLASRQRFDFSPLRFHDPRDREVATQIAALARSVRAALRAGGTSRAGGMNVEPAAPSSSTPADPASESVRTPQATRATAPTNAPPAAGLSGDRESKSPPTRGSRPNRPAPPSAQLNRLIPLTRWRDRIPGLPEDVCPEMITLPAGRFSMGAPEFETASVDDERPKRMVTVPLFALGRCAVTFAQWDAALAAGANLPISDDEGWGRGDRPVINVSWKDAQAYCAWLNQRLGLTSGLYRLPSEAEWEYACRAGTTTPFSFGDTISTGQANYDGSGTYGRGTKGEYRKRTVPVGSLLANAWGLHEMHGNVWEWCEDEYGPYPDHPTDASPLQHGNEMPRVLRGGSWFNYPRVLRSALRDRNAPEDRDHDVGFRVARTPGP
jgi:formylglycine-generating enzyme required for sulfatase activity